MIGHLLGSLLPLVIPVLGVLIVLVLQRGSSKPTKPGTSTKPEGSDHRDERRTP